MIPRHAHIPARIFIASAAIAALALPSAALADNAPSIANLQATEVGVTTSTLTGQVNPQGELGSGPTSWHLDYRPAGEEAWTQINSGTIEGAEAASHPAPGEEANPVEVTSPFGSFGESAPGGSYQFRVVAENGAGEVSASHAFTLNAPTPPALATEPTDEIGYTKATLHGTVDPEGGNSNPIGSEVFSIEWQLQYREAGVFGPGEGWNTAASNIIGAPEAAESNAIEVEAPLSPGALQPGKTYETRLLAYYFLGAVFQREAESSGSFETTTAPRPLVTIAAPSAITDAAAHFSGTVNPGAPKPASELQGSEPEEEEIRSLFSTNWHFECSPGCGVTPTGPQPVPADNTPEAVSGDATNLDPNTTYTISLHASNGGGEQVASEIAGQPVTFTTDAVSPAVQTGPLLPLAETVRLRGFVNPHNTALTDCRFEYGEDESYGQEAACESIPPTDNSSHEVAAYLPPLTPGATYHFRLLADNGAGSPATGEDETFIAPEDLSEQICPNQGRPGVGFLPDCRAWEMVSPPDKNGSDVLITNMRTRIAADGSAFAYASLSGFVDARSISVATDYLSERSGSTPTGWATHGISPPQEPLPLAQLFAGEEPLYTGEYSADLSAGVFFALSPLSADPNVAAVPNLYLRTDLRTPGPGAYSLLTACPLCAQSGTPLPPAQATAAIQWRPALAGASADFTQIAFESRQRLTATTAPQPATCIPDDRVFSRNCRTHLYDSDHGVLQLAGVLPDGSPADVSIAGQGAGSTRSPNLTPGVVSDGSDGHHRVFFTQPTDASGHTSSQVASAGQQRNINISWSGNVFMRVDNATTVKLNASERESADAFAPASFLDASADGTRAFFMSAQALTDDAPAGGSKIYAYNAVPDQDGHHLLFVSKDSQTGASLGTAFGMIGAGDDGSYSYFIVGPPATIYVWHEGEVRAVGPAPTGVNIQEDLGTGVTWSLSPWQAGVTPDGRHLLFSAVDGAGLTGYEHSVCPSGDGCRELYVYSADTATVACASCNPSGAPASADAFAIIGGETIGGTRIDPTPGHTITADGSRAFFTSPEALLAADTNGHRDAYQYDTASGHLSLLSTGTDPSDSYFLGTDPGGENAFILTRQRLVGWDHDNAYDVYDARVGGGFPEPQPQPAPCQGEACHLTSPAAPTAGSTTSATLVGSGNSDHRHCPRGARRTAAESRRRCRPLHTKHRHHRRSHRRASR